MKDICVLISTSQVFNKTTRLVIGMKAEFMLLRVILGHWEPSRPKSVTACKSDLVCQLLSVGYNVVQKYLDCV